MEKSKEANNQWDRAAQAAWLKSGCVFKLPEGQIFLGWGESEQLEQPHPEKPSLYVPDFYLENKKPWKLYENTTFLSYEKLIDCLKDFGAPPAGSEEHRQWQDPEIDNFKKVFERIQTGIGEGALRKAVPVVFATSEGRLHDFEKFHAVKYMVMNKSQKAYGHWDATSGILGLSPETLFELDKNVLKTHALAGTRNSSVSDEDFLNNSKEMHEHSLVIEDIQQRLSGFADVQVGATGVANLGRIKHLQTPIVAQLKKPVSFEQIIDCLHPTPALGTLPRKQDLSDLRYLECDLARGSYGAPFGLRISEEKAFALVAIRNVRWDQKNTYLGSGCGIVAESRLESEWEELELKRSAVKSSLGFEL